MKTQIIQLSKNDDAISVCDKMSWSQTRRILLDWKDAGTFLHNKLDLILIKRQATRLGAQLAIATNDAEIRFNAEQLDIPVFADMRMALDSQWNGRNDTPINIAKRKTTAELLSLRNSIRPNNIERMKHPAVRACLFGISVLALISLGFFVLPGATIRLSPKAAIQSMTFTVNTSSSLTPISLSTYSVPSEEMEVSVEGEGTKQSTGRLIIPDQPATVELMLTNFSGHEIMIPAGLVVSTQGGNPVRFAITSKEMVVIQPDSLVYLEGRAIIPGPSGNLPAETLVEIDGEIDTELVVTNPEASHGGTDASIPSPSIEDIISLRDELTARLKQEALSRLQSELSDQDTLIVPSLNLVEVMDESVFPEAGQPGEEVNLTMRMRFQAEVVRAEELSHLARPIMDVNLEPGMAPIPDSIKFYPLSDPTLDPDGNAYWTVRAERKVQEALTPGSLPDQIKGLSIPEAREVIENYLPYLENIQITKSPRWWPWLPFVTMRMNVLLNENK